MINVGAALSSADVINGGAGTDTLTLAGNYPGAIVFGSTTVTSVEVFIIDAGGTVGLTLDPGIFTDVSGTPLFDATSQGSSDGLVLDASALTGGITVNAGAVPIASSAEPAMIIFQAAMVTTPWRVAMVTTC